MPAFEGVFSVLPTPFAPSGEIDPASLKRVIDVFIADGVNGLTALGVTSEVARLTDAERDAALDTVLTHVDGRVPVVAGSTADGLRTCIEYTRRAKAAGASAVMISPPRMPKINSDAVARHLIIVQDYPPISGYAMEAPLLAHHARHPCCTHHQTRGSAHSVQDGTDSRTGGGARRQNLRWPWAVCFCSRS